MSLAVAVAVALHRRRVAYSINSSVMLATGAPGRRQVAWVGHRWLDACSGSRMGVCVALTQPVLRCMPDCCMFSCHVRPALLLLFVRRTLCASLTCASQAELLRGYGFVESHPEADVHAHVQVPLCFVVQAAAAAVAAVPAGGVASAGAQGASVTGKEAKKEGGCKAGKAGGGEKGEEECDQGEGGESDEEKCDSDGLSDYDGVGSEDEEGEGADGQSGEKVEEAEEAAAEEDEGKKGSKGGKKQKTGAPSEPKQKAGAAAKSSDKAPGKKAVQKPAAKAEDNQNQQQQQQAGTGKEDVSIRGAAKVIRGLAGRLRFCYDVGLLPEPGAPFKVHAGSSHR